MAAMLVPDLLRRATDRDGPAVAVVDGDRALSYQGLQLGSDRVAAALVESGVTPGDRVALLMRKSDAAVVAIHALFKLGCSYAPLDPGGPPERVGAALRSYGVRAVVADAPPSVEMARCVHEAGAAVFSWGDLVATGERAPAAPPVVVTGEQPAAVLTTSGSTGQPKGVVITHANLAVFAAWGVAELGLVPGDRLLSHAPLQFDLSFFDLFAAVAAGTATVLVSPHAAGPAELSRQVRAARVTVWQSVPSAITLLVEAAARGVVAMPEVRCVLFAGERMPRRTLLRCPDLFPGARLYNIYGATETNDTFLYRVPVDPADSPDPLPIGEPFPYVEYRLVDEEGADVAPGAPGHLLVTAPTVMAGYVSEAGDVTPAPRRDYPTRDVVSIGEDGQARFHGRTDAIVKTNGYRVNTLEIEDHVRALPAVEEAAVLAVPDPLVGTRLVAVVRIADGARCSALDLKVHCANRLPKYAIPHRFEIVREALPVSPTGKVDKRRLVASLLM